MNRHQLAQLRALDVAHHLPAQSDYRAIAERGGSRIIESAQGCTIVDADGREVLDGMAGLWCVAVGYGREELVAAAATQMARLSYYNTFFSTATEPTVRLASAIANKLGPGLEHVFFNNSGSECADTVLRLVRHYWALDGRPERQVVIARENAYHGSTVAGASLGGIQKMHAQGGLPIPDIEHIPAPYPFLHAGDCTPEAYGERVANALEERIQAIGPERVAAFIAEPVQGAGGVVIPPASYWPRIQAICRTYDVLLVADEVITGFGRTGAWFGHQRFDFEPDLVMMAKGLSSGYFPIAAVAVRDRIVEALKANGGEFTHGFTYSGHPVGAAVALENLAIIERERLVERVRDGIGPYFAARLQSLAEHPVVGEVRAIGLLGALDLVADRATRQRFEPEGRAGALCRDACLEAGLVVRALGDVIALCPPLIISQADVDRLLECLRFGLDRVAATLGSAPR